MSSWAVVCDVYYLEPQRIQPGENGIAFSNRVKKLIADKAGLRNVSYDGYLKHFEVKQSLIEKQQKMYADILLKRLSPSEVDEIAREESLEAERKAAHISPRTAAATASFTAGPDSLALSPSPDVPSLSAVSRALNRSVSEPRAGSVTGGIQNVSSSADLIQLLNQKQEEERQATSQLKHRKNNHPTSSS